MATIDAKLAVSNNRDVSNLYQRFNLTEHPEHTLLTFKDEDNTEFGYLRPNITRAIGSLLKDSSLEFEAVSPSLDLRETIGRAKKAADAMVKVDINIYGPRSAAASTGAVLSSNRQWLQKPDHARRGYAYDNPHFLAFPGMEHIEEAAQRDVVSGGPGTKRPRGEQLRHLMSSVYGSLSRGRDLERVQGGNQVTRKLLG